MNFDDESPDESPSTWEKSWDFQNAIARFSFCDSTQHANGGWGFHNATETSLPIDSTGKINVTLD